MHAIRREWQDRMVISHIHRVTYFSGRSHHLPVGNINRQPTNVNKHKIQFSAGSLRVCMASFGFPPIFSQLVLLGRLLMSCQFLLFESRGAVKLTWRFAINAPGRSKQVSINCWHSPFDLLNAHWLWQPKKLTEVYRIWVTPSALKNPLTACCAIIYYYLM